MPRTEAKLVIVQPYVPAYRAPFFERLATSLAERGVTCTVAAPLESLENRGRVDSVRGYSWMRPTRGRALRVGPHIIQTFGANHLLRDADAVVLGLLGSSPDVYRAIAARWFRDRRLGLWGHIKSYTKAPSRIDQHLENWQVNHCDRVFAYTPSGADFAQAMGVPGGRITTVMNSVDTEPTLNCFMALTDEDIERFATNHRLVPGHTFAYVGALDASKRVDFLARALDVLWTVDPRVRVLVAGRGADEFMLGRAVQRGQAIMLGYAGPRQKALLARVSSALLIPGRVGLVAVEALALGLPVVTVSGSLHGPEFEYLRQGDSVLVSGDDPAAYVQTALRAIDATRERVPGRHPTLEAMVDNFATGAVQLLDATR